MNFFNLKVSDALTVWDGVKSKIEKTIISRQKECDGLDYSFITPSILGRRSIYKILLFPLINVHRHDVISSCKVSR